MSSKWSRLSVSRNPGLCILWYLKSVIVKSLVFIHYGDLCYLQCTSMDLLPVFLRIFSTSSTVSIILAHPLHAAMEYLQNC